MMWHDVKQVAIVLHGSPCLACSGKVHCPVDTKRMQWMLNYALQWM